MVATTGSRRQRLRQQAFEEIHTLALRQVDDGGAEAVSLNAIAREMGMSGPALYRYYASRDDLLAALVTAGYAELTTALRDAARAAADQPPTERLQALALAYRGWATAHSRHYELLFGIRPRGARTDPAEAVDTAHGSMRLLQEVFLDLVRDRKSGPPGDTLDRELQSWSARRADPDGVPPLVLRLGVLAWTRLHGIVGLELTGALSQMNLDPALLIEQEVRNLIADAGLP